MPSRVLTAIRARIRTILLVVVGAVAVFVLAELIPYGVSNPSKDVEPRWDSARTRALVVQACGDCHSNRTRSTWYENIVPVKWWIANHVKAGRAALNFSEWDRPQGEGAFNAAHTVLDGSMPPAYYTWFGLHSGGKLSAADAKALANGLVSTISADPPAGGAVTPAGG